MRPIDAIELQKLINKRMPALYLGISLMIEEIPTLDVKPVIKGKWITKIKSDLRGDMWPTNPKCSECGGEPYYLNTIYNYKFCPYCGADMKEVEE